MERPKAVHNLEHASARRCSLGPTSVCHNVCCGTDIHTDTHAYTVYDAITISCTHTHTGSRARIKDVCEGTGSHFNDARVSNNRKKKYTHTHIYTGRLT